MRWPAGRLAGRARAGTAPDNPKSEKLWRTFATSRRGTIYQDCSAAVFTYVLWRHSLIYKLEGVYTNKYYMTRFFADGTRYLNYRICDSCWGGRLIEKTEPLPRKHKKSIYAKQNSLVRVTQHEQRQHLTICFMFNL